MSKASFTPGPWQKGPELWVAGPGAFAQRIAVVDETDDDSGHFNALLIAAAPTGHDLLAALAAWWAESGDEGPRASALFDDDRTWHEAVADYLRATATD